jgi:NO-binding membrane sensor protein with MHYT domain
MLSSIFHPHDINLVILSFVIAVFAAFVSLELAGRIKATNDREKFGWLLAAGISMGGGIWSMHFVAMIALELPVTVAYDLRLTVLSFLIAIIFATTGIYTVFWHKGSVHRFILGGTIMGLGVTAMHYFGMAALISK